MHVCMCVCVCVWSNFNLKEEVLARAVLHPVRVWVLMPVCVWVHVGANMCVRVGRILESGAHFTRNLLRVCT